MQPFIRDRLKEGRVLDVGCGRCPYHEACDSIVGLDKYGGCMDVMADAEKPLPFGDNAFQMVLLSEVLEHLWPPRDVLNEIHRVLTNRGTVLITVPFLHPIHGRRDFWRPTDEGLRRTLKNAGFANITVEPKYGYFTLLATLLLDIPGVRKIPHAVLFRRILSKLDTTLNTRRSWVTGWNAKARAKK